MKLAVGPARGSTDPFHAVHAWIWHHSADGLFADESPDISCEECD
jgi:hypothetical protein